MLHYPVVVLDTFVNGQSDSVLKDVQVVVRAKRARRLSNQVVTSVAGVDAVLAHWKERRSAVTGRSVVDRFWNVLTLSTLGKCVAGTLNTRGSNAVVAAAHF